VARKATESDASAPRQQVYEAKPGAACAALPSGYRRRDPEATVLHEVVREHLSTFLLECAQEGGLPRFVEKDFTAYLECGVLAHGFSRVVCSACKDEFLLAYSCKHRGVCPSCNARRAHDTAIHLEAAVLPRLPYRQWTLSFPMRLRFLLARDAAALSDALNLFVRALFTFQRRSARKLGIPAPHTGAVAFVQRFGSALQLTPHFHVLVPEAVFERVPQMGPETEALVARPHSLPPPDDEEVERLLRTVALRVVRLFRKQGKLDNLTCDGVLDALRAQATQQRLPLGEEPSPPKRRCAFLEGFSLHANTRVHENDRDNLRRLCAYGARGPLSLERLSWLPDGRVAYRMKRPAASGQTELVLEPLEFLRRIAALVPPPRVNLVRFFGFFAPNASLRKHLVPKPPKQVPSVPAAPSPPSTPATKYRVPWAQLLQRTFATDVLTCDRCGGPRRLVACVFSSTVAREILEHLRLPARPLPRAPARGPPQYELYA